jgi:hypothetical protein
MKIKAANAILYCKKWQEVVAFYRDGLKLLILSSNDWFVEFKLNEMSRLSVADEARTSIDSSDGKGITISLQIVDIEQTQAELLEAGIIPTPIRKFGFQRQSTSMTPRGIDLNFGWDGQRRNEERRGDASPQISCTA